MSIITLTKQSAGLNSGDALRGDGAPDTDNSEILPPRPSEGDILRTISTAMVLAGIRALGNMQDREEAGEDISKSDVVCAVYAAMHRLK
jgi:hypothetical protein